MADLYDYVTTTGVIVPDTTDLQATIEAEFRTALGQDLVVTPDTPQGALISAETSARVSVVQNNAQLANQINPNEAGGIFLDAIAALMGLPRTGATRTMVASVVIGGQPQTNIPAGSLARTNAGDQFMTAGAITLDVTGVGTVDFIAVETGPIPCAAGALVDVVDMVLGWETVSNPIAGVLGVSQQSDESLRKLRTVTLARQGISINEAIISDLYAIDGVVSLTYRENYTNATATIDGISLVANSIWACVDGGTNADIAMSLLTNKTAGANWNGSVSVNVVDPNSGQSYLVKFQRPTTVAIYATVTISRGSDTSDPLVTVPQAIVDYANGLIPSEPGLVVGAAASPFEFAAAISYFHPGMVVKGLNIFTTGGTPGSAATIEIALNQKAITALSFIQVIVI